MNPVEELERSRKEAPAIYRRLLDPAGEAQPGDAAELHRVAHLLGRSADQVSDDADVVRRAAELVALEATRTEIEARRNDILERNMAHQQETVRLRMAREEERQQLIAPLAMIAGDILVLDARRNELSQIRRENPLLFPASP